MMERDIDDNLLRDLLESGEVRHKDSRRVWIAASFAGRRDNLICAAVALEDLVVVKTVMHHFRWRA